MTSAVMDEKAVLKYRLKLFLAGSPFLGPEESKYLLAPPTWHLYRREIETDSQVIQGECCEPFGNTIKIHGGK